MLPIGMMGGIEGGMAAGGGGNGILSMLLNLFGGGKDGGNGRTAIKKPQNQMGTNSLLTALMNSSGEQGMPNSMDVFNNYSNLFQRLFPKQPQAPTNVKSFSTMY